MYRTVLGLHNLIRWVVLLAGALTVILAWRGWLGRRQWTASEGTAARIFVGMLDLQFVVGISLYAYFSPFTHDAFGDIGAALRDAPVRYFLVEHPAIMLGAIGAAHAGAVLVKRASADGDRFQRASIWFGLALAAVAGFVPWARPLVPGF